MGSLAGSTAIGGFGAGFQAVGAYNQAKAQKASLEAQTQIEANNATLAGWQADDAVARGETAAARVQMQGDQVAGQTRAALAANGVDLSYGSALQTITDADYATAVDVNQTRANASREAWGYRMQASQATNRSGAASAGAGQVSPWLSTGTSLLGSATALSSRWYQGNKAVG